VCLLASVSLTRAQPAEENRSGFESIERIALTQEEKAWVHEQEDISVCVDPDWLPFERINEQGKHEGISADFFELFGALTGLKFRLVQTESWKQSQVFAEHKKCQLLSMLNQSEERSRYLDFTEPYVSAPVVIVTRDDEGYLDGLKSLSGQTITMVRGYIYEEFVRRDFPFIDIKFVSTSDQSLEEVSAGKAAATIGSLYIVTERIQRLGLANLKIAGPTDFRNQLRIGVGKNQPVLLSVLNKAVNSISPRQETEIISRWVKVKYELGQDYALAVQIGVISLVLFILLGYRSWVLTRYNHKLNAAYELLEKRTDELDRISHTDALTNIYNRLRLDETITNEVNRYKRYREEFSLIILDIDHFKQVNDKFGHPVGDRTLVELCSLIGHQLRSTDIFGRWGGEEFLIVCPATSKQEAVIIAEKLRQSVDNYHFEPVGHLTVSFGVTAIETGDGEKELVSRADKQLYRAKQEGRNRVCHD
jgi:diguanylate cyclase (GGDEF)-like protein